MGCKTKPATGARLKEPMLAGFRKFCEGKARLLLFGAGSDAAARSCLSEAAWKEKVEEYMAEIAATYCWLAQSLEDDCPGIGKELKIIAREPLRYSR